MYIYKSASPEALRFSSQSRCGCLLLGAVGASGTLLSASPEAFFTLLRAHSYQQVPKPQRLRAHSYQQVPALRVPAVLEGCRGSGQSHLCVSRVAGLGSSIQGPRACAHPGSRASARDPGSQDILRVLRVAGLGSCIQGPRSCEYPGSRASVRDPGSQDTACAHSVSRPSAGDAVAQA